MATGLSKLRQISYVVNDVERMSEYFSKTLNLTKLFDAPGMSFFDLGGVRLMMTLPADNNAHIGNSILYFDTKDIDASVKILQSAGVVFEREPFMVAKMPDHEFWLAFFRDPENNLLALSSEKPLT